MKPAPICSVQDGCIARVHCKDLGYCKEGSHEPPQAGRCYATVDGRACSSTGCDNGCQYPGPAAPANPKQAFGDTKLPLYLVPFSFVANVAVALFEGWGKYGLVNWRVANVEAMTYVSALERHIMKWTNGEKCDPKTKVPHLANAAACIAILIDAEVNGSLIDNRPFPCANIDAMIADLEAALKNLLEMNANENPKHWTIGDAE